MTALNSKTKRKTKSKIEFKNELPSPKTLGPAVLLIYDKCFEQKQSTFKQVQKWLEKFPYRIAFESGEELKDLKLFPNKIEKILNVLSQFADKNVQIVSFGGGSLGDFVGFAASVLKRGLPLVHIPTTWLSAMDSAHGGKTALNVAGFKNQIGTFYSAQQIFIVNSILQKQPPERSKEAFGEAVKMALLTGGGLWNQFSKLQTFDNSSAWHFLPKLVAEKYRIVNKDPFEKSGIRHLLNLGHTLGHGWEAECHLSHGTAVAYGIRAAIEFSKNENIMGLGDYNSLVALPVMGLFPTLADLGDLARRTANMREALARDKKLSKKQTLRFIFIKRPGNCVIKDVSIDHILKFHSFLQKYRPI